MGGYKILKTVSGVKKMGREHLFTSLPVQGLGSSNETGGMLKKH